MKKHAITLALILFSGLCFGQDNAEEIQEFEITEDIIEEMRRYKVMTDSINALFSFQNGKIEIGEGVAYIEVPDGFKYLDPKQSKQVLEDIWGNPPSSIGLGMLFPQDCMPASDFTYAIEINFSDEGYIDDEDAQELNYDELLEEMIEDTREESKERERMNYGTVELIRWASPPFYDAETKKLHWAKELNFDGAEENTLNYDIRILGRRGFLNLTAIADMTELENIKSDIDQILSAVHFNEGHTYADFNPDIDKIAAYGIGGLIAGKVLAKAGLLAGLAKFGKFILVGILALFGALRKRLFGKKEVAPAAVNE